jgi:beta-xylosidase
MGIAQGGLIDTPDGKWYSYLFRDYGSVGRIPYLVPVTWQDGWPVLGVNGKVPEILELPAGKSLIPGIVSSDEFNRKKGEPAMPIIWQWNHNPDNSLWSVTQRKGYLRLITGRIDTSFFAGKKYVNATYYRACMFRLRINRRIQYERRRFCRLRVVTKKLWTGRGKNKG